MHINYTIFRITILLTYHFDNEVDVYVKVTVYKIKFN